MFGTLRIRFLAKVEQSQDGCLVWVGDKNQEGYGKIFFSGKRLSAHRVAWLLEFGDPGQLSVLHKCDNPSCVNVDHLFLGTLQDNMDDKVKKGRQSRGERSGTAKLSEEDVREIRASVETNRALANRFGVNQATIGRIRTRENWSHVQ